MTGPINKLLFPLLVAATISGCHSKPDRNISRSESFVRLQPDYSDITLPPNIAPINFKIVDSGSEYYITFSAGKDEIEIFSHTGKIVIPEKRWKRLLLNNKGQELKIDVFIKNAKGVWTWYRTINNKIAGENIDSYIFYRVLYPGYESWAELSLNERCLENFSENSLIENNVADRNCVNCHSLNPAKPGEFFFHMRGSHGGTYFYSDGKLKKVNLKTKEMENGAVYPRWHPSGKYIAFSSNKIIQQFHSSDNKKIEVSDLKSSLFLYDIEKNEMMPVDLQDNGRYMDTYPEWSHDGRYLWFCRAPQVGETFDYREVRYNLYRAPFDPEKRLFGDAELIFNASEVNKSVAFPRISPDDRFLVVTLADYGCFPIWHKEADLFSIDLSTFKPTRLGLNSNFAESYHSWSSNGSWLLFSSKRDDGLTTRVYLAHMNGDGTAGKPFVLPQHDPEFYGSFLKSYNLPEFSTTGVRFTPGEIRRSVSSTAVQAGWYKK
jgi:hypothetical protein